MSIRVSIATVSTVSKAEFRGQFPYSVDKL